MPDPAQGSGKMTANKTAAIPKGSLYSIGVGQADTRHMAIMPSSSDGAEC